MRVAIVGASGLIGRALDAALRSDGHHVVAIGRSDPEALPGRTGVRWDARSPLDPEILTGCTAVVDLAGAPIDRRWTRSVKDEIFESRVRVTEWVADAATAADVSALVNGSAVGYYGAGEQPVTEQAGHGAGFLSDVCVSWETAAMRADDGRRRVVCVRTGVVLALEGGAFPRMLRPARLGLGGPIAGGKQWFPWIHIADAVAALRFAIATPDIAGPVNMVAPRAVRQGEFADTLGRVLHRPSVVPVPRFVLRAALGEAASTIATGQRVIPAVLESAGFTFRFPDVESALRDLLDRPS